MLRADRADVASYARVLTGTLARRAARRAWSRSSSDAALGDRVAGRDGRTGRRSSCTGSDRELELREGARGVEAQVRQVVRGVVISRKHGRDRRVAARARRGPHPHRRPRRRRPRGAGALPRRMSRPASGGGAGAAASWVRIALRSDWIFFSASPQIWAGGPATPGAATQPVRLNWPTSSASRPAVAWSAAAPGHRRRRALRRQRGVADLRHVPRAVRVRLHGGPGGAAVLGDRVDLVLHGGQRRRVGRRRRPRPRGRLALAPREHGERRDQQKPRTRAPCVPRYAPRRRAPRTRPRADS